MHPRLWRSRYVSIFVAVALLFSGVTPSVFGQTADQANASCQPVKDMEGKKCNTTVQGAIIQGTCQGGSCKAVSSSNIDGKQEAVNENTTEIQKSATEQAHQVNTDPVSCEYCDDRYAGGQQGEQLLRQNVQEAQGRGEDTKFRFDNTSSNGTIGGGEIRLVGGADDMAAIREIAGSYSPESSGESGCDFCSDSYAGLNAQQHTLLFVGDTSFASGVRSALDDFWSWDRTNSFSQGFSVAPTPSWVPSNLTGFSGESFSIISGENDMGSMYLGGAFGNQPSIPPTMLNGSGLRQVFGQGSVVYGAGANPQSAADAFFMQSKAQLDAKNAGTIANYLGDGSDVVWGEKSFGDMMSKGLGNAQQQFEGAWRGLQDGFSDAVTSVQGVFAPSAFDGAFGTDPATAFDMFSGTGIRVGESITIEAEGQTIPTFYNDQFVKSINENPRPLPSFGGERFAEYVNSEAVTRPTGGALSFANAHIQNPSFFVTQSGISVTAVEPPFTFEIGRRDTRSALDMPTRSISPFLSNPNPIVPEDAWKNAGQFNTASSFSRSPALGSSVDTAPVGRTADVEGKATILTSGVGRESVSTGRTSVGVSTGNGSGAMSGRGTTGGGTPAGGMGDFAGILKTLADMVKGGGGKGGGAQPQQPPIIAASDNILTTPVPSTQFAPPAPLTPAPQVSVVANPNPTQRDATSIVSWTAVWADAQPATSTRECAVIDATGKTHVDHASTTDSFETPKLSQGAYFVVGCKQSGGKLGSALILVRVEGDTQAPVAPPQAALASYESTNGQSAAGKELASALSVPANTSSAPQTPAQQLNVACDPNSSSYFDCLTDKMLFVDKLY